MLCPMHFPLASTLLLPASELADYPSGCNSVSCLLHHHLQEPAAFPVRTPTSPSHCCKPPTPPLVPSCWWDRSSQAGSGIGMARSYGLSSSRGHSSSCWRRCGLFAGVSVVPGGFGEDVKDRLRSCRKQLNGLGATRGLCCLGVKWSEPSFAGCGQRRRSNTAPVTPPGDQDSSPSHRSPPPTYVPLAGPQVRHHAPFSQDSSASTVPPTAATIRDACKEPVTSRSLLTDAQTPQKPSRCRSLPLPCSYLPRSSHLLLPQAGARISSVRGELRFSAIENATSVSREPPGSVCQ